MNHFRHSESFAATKYDNRSILRGLLNSENCVNVRMREPQIHRRWQRSVFTAGKAMNFGLQSIASNAGPLWNRSETTFGLNSVKN
jgi:hypothetical protein